MTQVYWSWQAEVKDDELSNFKELVKRWNAIAAEDPNTLFNAWTVSEDGRTVRVDQRFTDADTALAQFELNDCWGELDDYLVPAAMYVCGDYGKTLDFLREHGATFMESLA
ncbi:MAG: hypothetical protein ACR2RD_13860 [Woeseiaceae bacterium]